MSRKTDNLIICQDFFTIAGGIQRFNSVLYQALKVLYPSHINPVIILSLLDQSRNKLQLNFLMEGDEFISYNNRKLTFVLGIILTLLQKKPHNIYLTHINFAPLILLIQLFLPRSKVWIVLHGFEAWIKINKLSRLSVNLCAGILSVSSYTKNEFCKNNMISPTKVQVIYLTYGKYTWSPNLENNSIEDLDFSFVLCVSRLEPAHAYYKGVDKTILAIVALARSGRLGGYHLVIVGEGDDRQRLMELAEQEGIAHLVHFTGRISDIELKAYYAYCEMFVLPSTKEGFGLVYLEAMSFGKPVIASQEGASKEIVIDGLTGYLVPDGDIGALAGKISLLIDSKDERERLGKAGQERYLENFTFSKFVERLKTTLLE